MPYDRILQIRTKEDRLNLHSSVHYHRYEATPYHALDQLVDVFPLTEQDHVIDFGCGKGRLNFYLHYHFRCRVTGIEMNPQFYEEAERNLASYGPKTELISFEQCYAEQYDIPATATTFYFFNPFSVQIFMKVVQNIFRSYEQQPRPLTLILFYPSQDYIDYLQRIDLFAGPSEVRVMPEYTTNESERFLIYTL